MNAGWYAKELNFCFTHLFLSTTFIYVFLILYEGIPSWFILLHKILILYFHQPAA